MLLSPAKILHIETDRHYCFLAINRTCCGLTLIPLRSALKWLIMVLQCDNSVTPSWKDKNASTCSNGQFTRRTSGKASHSHQAQIETQLYSIASWFCLVKFVCPVFYFLLYFEIEFLLSFQIPLPSDLVFSCCCDSLAYYLIVPVCCIKSCTSCGLFLANDYCIIFQNYPHLARNKSCQIKLLSPPFVSSSLSQCFVFFFFFFPREGESSLRGVKISMELCCVTLMICLFSFLACFIVLISPTCSPPSVPHCFFPSLMYRSCSLLPDHSFHFC